MKYLGLHKLLWAIIVVALTFIEALILLFVALLFIIWNFELPVAFWKSTHTGCSRWDYSPYCDKNIWQTIKRRYNSVFD